MSQFDFPRINFSGRAFINPATANNNLLLPLLTYDPIQVKPVLPPRIYLSSELLLLHKLGGLPIPDQQPIHTDSNQHQYIEIEPVNTKETFLQWAKAPLGSCPIDAPYHQLYPLVKTKRTKQPLTGQLPASWNFFGGMEFGFLDVYIQSVVLSDAKSNQIQHITSDSTDIPHDLAKFIGAKVDLNHDNGAPAAVMIDVIPSLAFFSQVFCDSMRLINGEHTLMQGKPRKASLRFLNQHRIINQDGAMAASGTFFTVIPVADLHGGDESPILKLFRQYGHSAQAIKGVFIRYNLFEVQEDLFPDYSKLGQQANPAYATVVGSFSPWYESDMVSIGVGRQLLSEHPFLGDKTLSSCMCSIDMIHKRITLDLLSSIPEEQLTNDATPSYDVYPVGSLTLKLSTPEGTNIKLGNLVIGPDKYTRNKIVQTSGLIDFPICYTTELTQEALETGTLALYGYDRESSGSMGNEVILLKESEFLITTDQAGLYADQGQSPEVGFRSYSAQKEPCVIRVFRKGQPVTSQLSLLVMALTITEFGASSTTNEFLYTTDFKDNYVLNLPTDQAVNRLYVFYPEPQNPSSSDIIQYISKTGFFVNVRVLPQHDFGPYLQSTHPQYPTALTFDAVYNEVLKVYDLIFPMSSIITPFTEANFQKGWPFLKQRMDPNLWHSASYMPSSRDLSLDQWSLFCKWADQLEHQKNINFKSA